MSYYSGQGILYAADRNTDGTPKGFLSLGNVPVLELSVTIDKFEHKESMSGQRAVDLSIIKEKKGTFKMTMEDMNAYNLAMAFWGTNQAQSASTLTDLELVASVHATQDMRVPIQDYANGVPYASLTGVTVADDATPTVTYEFGESDGDEDSKNGWVDLANGTIVIFSTAKQTLRDATVLLADEDPMFVNATTTGATQITHAFTQTSMEKWLRFEGLNTIDGQPVLIDMFKANLDPLSGYPLINEEISSFEITGSVLYDALQKGTSKFFRQVNV